MKIYRYKILFILILLISILQAQGKNVIAEIGDVKITSEEFRTRFELSPRLSKGDDLETEKSNFLLTLIAEKFLAKEAVKDGLLDNKEMKIKLKSLLKKYVRDRLFQKEISEKVKITKEEMESEIFKSSRTLFCNFLISDSRKEIDSLHSILLNQTIDSVLTSRPEKVYQKDLIKLSVGESNINLENEIFYLNPGQFTKPVKTEVGWVIYYVKNVELKSVDISNRDEISKIKKRIRERKTQTGYFKYMRTHVSQLKVNADIDLFNKLSAALYAEIKKIPGSDTAKYIVPDYKQVQRCKTSISKKELLTGFIKFDRNPVSLDNFIDELSAEEIKFNVSSLNKFKKSLDNFIKEYIKFEHLFRIGSRKGLEVDDQVRKTVKIWEENYLASLKRKELLSKIDKQGSSKYEEFIYKIAELSQKYNINLDKVKLNKIKVNPVNIIVYKHFGFGGRGLAVPYTTINAEWFDIRQKLNQKLDN